MPYSALAIENILRNCLSDYRENAIVILGDGIITPWKENLKAIELIKALLSKGALVCINSSWGYKKLRERFSIRHESLYLIFNAPRGLCSSAEESPGNDDYLDKIIYDRAVAKLALVLKNLPEDERAHFSVDGDRIIYLVDRNSEKYAAAQATCHGIINALNKASGHIAWMCSSDPHGLAIKPELSLDIFGGIKAYLEYLCVQYRCSMTKFFASRTIFHLDCGNNPDIAKAMAHIKEMQAFVSERCGPPFYARAGFNIEITSGQQCDGADMAFGTADQACDWFLGVVSTAQQQDEGGQ